MNALLFLLFFIAAFLALVSWITSRPRGRQYKPLANVAEGFQPASQTFLTDGVFGSRYLLVKGGSDAAHVALSGVGDIPKGIAHDSSAAAEEPVTVHKFGLRTEGAIGVASGAIDVEELLVPGANGTVRTLPATPGIYNVIGRATKAAADTDTVEYTPCFPTRVVVPDVVAAPAAAAPADGVFAALNSTAVNPTKDDFDALLAQCEILADSHAAAVAKLTAIHTQLVAAGIIVAA